MTLYFILFFFLNSAHAAIEQGLVKKVVKIKEYSIQEVLQKNLTGLQLQPRRDQTRWLQDAKHYAELRKKAKTGRAVSCSGQLTQPIFCSSLIEWVKKNQEPKKGNLLGKDYHLTANKDDVARWIKSADLKNLDKLGELELRPAFRQALSPSDLEALRSQITLRPVCQNPMLNYWVGSKLEEFFPQSETETKVLSLYENVALCPTSPFSLKAKAKLGLLYVGNEKCSKALPHLDYVALHSPSNDEKSRALYWSSHCNQILGNQPISKQRQKDLLEHFPFSLHSLLSQNNKSTFSLPLLSQKDPKIQLRTETNPEINIKLNAVEALIRIHEDTLAGELLESPSFNISKTEPEFKLYIVILYRQLNSYHRAFRLLSALFREFPQLASRSSLELSYPRNLLKSSDLKKAGIDQRLVLSLVRQESAFNTRALSVAGAMGLMQILPSTARKFQRIKKANKLFEPATNLQVGSQYFSELLKRYNGDTELALAAYNAGPKRVTEWLTRYPVKNRILFLDLIPFKETRDYVSSIGKNFFWYGALYPDPLQKTRNLKIPHPELQIGVGGVFRLLSKT